MAKDEGNGGGGGQNLARVRPDLSGEMSLQLLPADDTNERAVAARTPDVLPRGFVSATWRDMPRANFFRGRRED
jgi:hypothetical protein